MDFGTQAMVDPDIQRAIATPGFDYSTLLPKFGGDNAALAAAVQAHSSGSQTGQYDPDAIARFSQENIMAKRQAAGAGGFDPGPLAAAMQGRQMDTGGSMQMPGAGGSSAQSLASFANIPASNPGATQSFQSPNWNPSPVSAPTSAANAAAGAPPGSGISGYPMAAPAAGGLTPGLPVGGGLSSLTSPSMAIPQQYGGLSGLGSAIPTSTWSAPAAGPRSSLYSQIDPRKGFSRPSMASSR